jgi:hypothetical protein
MAVRKYPQVAKFVRVPGFGQLEVPIPRSSCRQGGGARTVNRDLLIMKSARENMDIVAAYQ